MITRYLTITGPDADRAVSDLISSVQYDRLEVSVILGDPLLDQVAAALRRRGLLAVSEDGSLFAPGDPSLYDIGPAGGHWAGDRYASAADLEDGAPIDAFVTSVVAGSEDVERIAAAIVAAIQKQEN